MDTVTAVAAGTAVALIGAATGAGVGVLMVFLFYQPDRRRGPTARIIQAIWTGTLILLIGEFWIQAFGFDSPDAGADPVDLRTSIPLAAGVTIGSGWLGLRRWRRHRQMLRSDGGPAAGAAGTTGIESGAIVSTGTDTCGPAAPVPVWRRRLRLAVRFVDYAYGLLFCWAAIVGAAAVGQDVRPRSATWFFGQAHALTVVGTQAVLAAAGLAYSQLVSGVARKAMDAALARDWRVSRPLHYALLALPFVLALPAALAFPGLLTGILVQLGTLCAGWRWTTERPSTPLRTARLVRERLRLRRQERLFVGRDRVQPTTPVEAGARPSGVASCRRVRRRCCHVGAVPVRVPMSHVMVAMPPSTTLRPKGAVSPRAAAAAPPARAPAALATNALVCEAADTRPSSSPGTMR
jgi:hypothetical protein